jgi:uncharacterized membrane protein
MATLTNERTGVNEASNSLPLQATRHRPFLRAIIWGVVSLSLYFLVFLNQGVLTEFFSKGGILAVSVIIIALAFSLIHGSFANYVLDVFGIEALKHKKGGH